MPFNYSNGKIYKIWSPSHPEQVYIGSTAEPRLSARMSKHRSCYKRYLNGKSKYVTSYKILDYEDCRIDLIEKYPCADRSELNAREGYYVRTLDCVNKVIPGRTHKQYYQENKDRFLQIGKQYREDNKENIKKMMKLWYEANKEDVLEKSKKYRQDNKEVIKQRKKDYADKNKDKVAAQQKRWYEANKQRLLQKVTCECGAVISKASMSKHKKSQVHMKAMKN